MESRVLWYWLHAQLVDIAAGANRASLFRVLVAMYFRTDIV